MHEYADVVDHNKMFGNPVDILPGPNAIGVDQVRMGNQKIAVMLRIGTPMGMFYLFLEPENVLLLAEELTSVAKLAASGIVRAPESQSTLIIPGQ